ncbi:MAG: DMSO reductase [Martelella sp.]|uniref:dimethyl sulfoxide reductase anchor subunit family protein n=1 Tax=unclassified Martelella TaxID=2629616 RepID=UPI000C480C57|nr:DmsC/YnfH family molybdoenzyme membrane anchor subunit [Martelella sp.]MAU23368.1 DMSO reductase [Martelella sp.]|tara:strand:- start:1226 stop:2161 length:936 start_codon:yes stop_codon:yes gene_type:complete
MHPAFSVIFFTTASGAGYGLLFLLGLAAAFGLLPPDPWFGLVGFGLSLGLISAGLLTSTAHLGRPERAWRAFSQWRSSWLSREGVSSVATYVPAVALAFGWVILQQSGGWMALAGALAAIGAVATVIMTAMIYASLKPIAEWHGPWTLPAYLVFAAMTGLTLLNALLAIFGPASRLVAALAAVLALSGWVVKRGYWAYRDSGKGQPTANEALGLGEGDIRQVQSPHSEQNYLLKEMGYRVARKHAARLRLIAQLLAFVLPAVCLVLSLLLPGPLALVLVLTAVPLQLAGMLVERWLFFAEARHTVTLYYGY